MRIDIRTIPHKTQRYPTVGDYYKKHGTLHFRISQMNPDYEFLVLIHELIECHLTKRKGISIEKIDAFDIQFEQERAEGKHGPYDEPGHDPRAPYRNEHVFAESIERIVAERLKVNWDLYNETVTNL